MPPQLGQSRPIVAWWMSYTCGSAWVETGAKEGRYPRQSLPRLGPQKGRSGAWAAAVPSRYVLDTRARLRATLTGFPRERARSSFR